MRASRFRRPRFWLWRAVGGGTADGGSPDTHDLTIVQSSVARVVASEVSSADLNATVAANRAFAVDFHARALKGRESKNVLTPPISATLALTMAFAGPKRTTQA